MTFPEDSPKSIPKPSDLWLRTFYVCMVITESRVWINRVKLPILLVVSSTGKTIFLCLLSRMRIWSRETCGAIPSRFSPLILQSEAESSIINHQSSSGAYSSHSSRFPRRRPFLCRQQPSGESRVRQVTQSCTDGVHRRESADTGPVVLKIVPVKGAAFSGITIQFLCTSLFLNPQLVQWTMCETENFIGSG